MRALYFEDPNILTRGAFEVNGCKLIAPVFTSESVQHIIDSTSCNAASYFATANSAFQTINKSFKVWNDPNYALRQKVLPILANLTQFSEPNIVCFGLMPLQSVQFEPDELGALPQLIIHLIETGRYQSFTSWKNGYIKGYGTPKITRYDKPRKVLQILAGNVVGPTWLSVSLGAALQCPQFIKLPYRDLASFMVYLQSLDEIDHGFRATIACGYYPNEDDKVNTCLLKEADVVVAMGSDSTIDAIRTKLQEVKPKSRLIPHGHKISLQIISKEYTIPEVAELAAWGIIAFDGNGCFSPTNIYVESGGHLNPQRFAEALASSLASISSRIPPKRTLEVAERITNYRHSQIQRRLLGENIRIIKSTGTDYTVIIDYENPKLEPTCQERVVIVKPIRDIRTVPKHIGYLSRNLQTVGIAVPSSDVIHVANELGAIGVTNIKLVGTEYIVDIAEPHDGLFDFVQLEMTDELRWTSISFKETDRSIQDALNIKEACLRHLRDLTSTQVH